MGRELGRHGRRAHERAASGNEHHIVGEWILGHGVWIVALHRHRYADTLAQSVRSYSAARA